MTNEQIIAGTEGGVATTIATNTAGDNFDSEAFRAVVHGRSSTINGAIAANNGVHVALGGNPDSSYIRGLVGRTISNLNEVIDSALEAAYEWLLRWIRRWLC